jgi:hypothetical protein
MGRLRRTRKEAPNHPQGVQLRVLFPWLAVGHRNATLGRLVLSVVIWVVMGGLYAWVDSIENEDPDKVWAVCPFYGLGLLLNVLVASWCGDMRQNSLLDHGFEEV